ncbi:MAG TPA: TfoX/Sxy family protein [Rudaea sp.]|nr:TfoX/Sxy family protein [Rudaea sp.]
MSFDEDLATSVRAALAGAGAVHEIKMFGGIGFMLNGNMIVAASRRGLLVRVGKDQQRAALTRPGARPMVMRDRVMEGYVRVDPPATTDAAVRAWIKMALTFVLTLPPKAAKTAKPAKMGKPTAKKATGTKAKRK